MQKTAIYAGTFDPITNGHLDIISRALKLFDKIIIGIAETSRKSPCIPIQDRLDLCRKIFADNSKIEVDRIDQLAIDFAKEHNAQFFIRGLRSVTDFDYEIQMAVMNDKMAPEIETIFLPASAEHSFISSTMVREIISLNRDPSAFVPKAIVEYFQKKNGLKNN